MASKIILTFLRKPPPPLMISFSALPFRYKSSCYLPSLSSPLSTSSVCSSNAALSLSHPSVQKLLQQLHENANQKDEEMNQVVRAIVEKQNEVRELITMGKENADLKEIAEADAEKAKKALAELEKEFFSLVVEPDKMDHCTEVMLEVSAGVGGQEAMLFTSELLEMYSNYAMRRGWQCEELARDETEIGGLRHGSLAITGPSAYKILKFEGGVHRVQRVPKTEKSGRIHTSASTVAILPMPKDIDVDIRQQDLKIEKKRASGPGGMNINKSETAIRITHLPSGITVECQVERSSLKNMKLAMKNLRAKLHQLEVDKQATKEKTSRKLQVGSGGRNEKIRTYNYTQDRVTDHRVGFTTFNIKQVLEGGEAFDDVISNLQEFNMQERLEEIFK